MKNVYVIGDLHTNWYVLNKFIKNKNPDIILQVGDFGFWPHFHGSDKFKKGEIFDQYNIVSPKTNLYFIDGNHDNHEVLQKLTKQFGHKSPIKMEKFTNVFYMPRCSTLNVNNKTILFIGGAKSIDKKSRTPYISWWPEEEPTYKDFENLPDIKIDIVISHTLPEMCLYFVDKYFSIGYQRDFTRLVLNEVFEKYNPKKWFFGHWHMYKKFNFRDCEFTCLNECNGDYWYEKIF